jgi:predicted TPR repeat methyltransferase
MKRRPPTAAAAAPAVARQGPSPLLQAVELLRAERIDEAEPLLLGVLQHDPLHPDALHFLGVLRHTQGRTDEAVALIRRSLDRAPANAGAWNNLGNVLLLAGRLDEVAEVYERAVQHADKPQEAVLALNNLCTLHRKRDALDLSEASARQALARDPDFGDAWYNLSLTLLKQGQVHEGLIAHSKAVALWPRSLQPRHEVIRALMLLGHLEQAAGLLREWLAEGPDNPVAQHLLAACEAGLSGQAPERASDGYVQQVFDGFAESFDAKLQALGYRAPELVVAALRAAAGAPAAALDICDAGVGTGLCGAGLKPFARRLVGCDLSVGMLKRAQALRLYDTLHQAELVHYLGTQPDSFDAVVSADTLCYFGALEGAAAAAARALRPGGWLVFTVEALPDDHAQPHWLQPNGRYAHRVDHVRHALASAGLREHALQRDSLRQEAGHPVPGWLVTAQRPGAGG